MWFVWLLCIAVAILIEYLVAARFRDIAELKGHDGTPYFWFCFFLTIWGYLMVIALPDLRLRDKLDAIGREPAAPAEAQPSGSVRMPVQPAQPELPHNKKECPHCGARNNLSNTACFACGKEI